MRKQENENYAFCKRSLLVELFMFYYTDVSYDSIVLRSFGFSFDPTCNFKAIITSKKGNIHKYTTHIFYSLVGCNLESYDVMGNFNIIKVRSVRNFDPFIPQASINVYFDGIEFTAVGYMEGKKVEFTYKASSKNKDELLYALLYDKALNGINSSVESFRLYLMKLYCVKLPVDLVMGAGINADYGGKSWTEIMDSLNNDFYKGDYQYADEISKYVGKELFTSSMVLKTSGFDFYDSLNRELYQYNEGQNFDVPESTLYNCVEYIKKKARTTVITYNFDTNLEYLLKKKGVRYTVVYDDNSFDDMASQVEIYHVHGLLPYGKENERKFTDSIIFTESDYFYLYNNPYSWNISKQLHDFKFHECLFIGISLTDPDMKRILELAKNYLKFNFIFMRKQKGYSDVVFRDLTSYFFTFDLIVIWVDDYKDIGFFLERIA